MKRPGHDYVCAPSPGNERGRGTYHVVAVDDQGRQYQADVSDAFDACGGSRELIILAP